MFCSFAIVGFLWFQNKDTLPFEELILVFVTIAIFYKIFELINSISKLSSSINTINNQQNGIEKKIRKISSEIRQLNSKFAKLQFNVQACEKQSDATDGNKIDTEIVRNQLELNINQKTNQLPVKLLKADLVPWDILLKALHFPSDKNDTSGFVALNLARKNNSIFQLLRVSEDFLNLLAQDGIYLDDLKIEPPPVKAWLNFIDPEKKLCSRRLSCNGVDTQIKNLKVRIKSDTVFRDTALMLMRRFDKLLRDKLHSAEDHQIFQIANTRSGKAFLIVGRILDTF